LRLRTLTLLLLLFVFGRLILSEPYKAPTMDEPHHIARGLVYLTQGRNVWNGNPPLAHLLMAAPLLLDSSMVPDSAKLQSTDFRILGQAFLQTVQPRWRAAFFVARLPNMLMLLILLAIVAAWTSRWFGRRAGAIVLLLCAFDPNLLANAQLATPDIAVTLFCAGAGYQAWRFNRTGRRRDALLLGVWAGLALSTKYTAIVVVGLIGVAMVIQRMKTEGERMRTEDGRRTTATRDSLPPSTVVRLPSSFILHPSSFILSGLLAAFVVWAVYRFNIGAMHGFLLPAPDYLGELLWQATINGLHRSSFLADHLYPSGVTLYFLLAFLLKTPTAVAILLLAALVGLFFSPRVSIFFWMRNSILRLRGAHPERMLSGASAETKQKSKGAPLRSGCYPERTSGIGLPAIVFLGYFALVLLSPLNIGYRHLLPILPFAYLLIGSQLPSARRSPERSAGDNRQLPTAILLALMGWTAATSLANFPYDLAYFAEWSGGPQRGFHWLVDSNLDWGQDLYALAPILSAEPAPVFTSYFGPTDMRALGLRPELVLSEVEGLPNWDHGAGAAYHPANPDPGLYAISATNLQGVILSDPDAFDFFRRRRPDVWVGDSILLYRVPEAHPAPNWIAACDEPDFQISSPALEQLLGSGHRILHFDCGQSWVVPFGAAQGKPPGLGWYVLPGEMPNAAQAWGGKTELVYRQSDKLSVYLYDPQGFQPPGSESATFTGNVKFLGATRSSSGAVITFWQTLGPASDLQLSIYGHHLAPDGYMLEAADGLGFSPVQWQAGDIFLQWHKFTSPFARGEFFETGVYNWQTGQRLLTVPALTPPAFGVLPLSRSTGEGGGGEGRYSCPPTLISSSTACASITAIGAARGSR